MSINAKFKSRVGILTLATVSMATLVAACDQGGATNDEARAASDIAQDDACNPCAGANPCVPDACNPCAAKACNPCAANACNPCAANACNPCAAANPCAAKACNPCAANACNPCAAKACNPCSANPCAAANPCGGCNPCNPCAGSGGGKDLSSEAMEAAYNTSKAGFGTAYAKSGNATAGEYQGWTRFNKGPYPSATHGGRMVNNYSNEIGAKEYGKFEEIGTMAVGSILAKDSLVFDKNGNPSAGPLFLMEKMPAGFMDDYGNWKYTMILPNGSVWGETLGKNSGGMQFCIDCHFAAEDYDYLFFLPEENRK